MVKNEKKVLLVIGGVSIALAGMGGFGIHYVYGRIGEEQEKIAKANQELDVANGKIKEIRKLEDAVIILRENVQDYAKILPDEREVTKYARTLSQYITNAGMVLTELAPNTRGGSKGKGFASIRYSLKMNGTFWQAMRLISYLENHPRFMEVKSLKIKAGEKDANSPFAIHRVEMVVETYTYKKPKGGAGEVKISNYALKKANLEHEIHKKRVIFDRQSYTFNGHNGRRDILVDPRFCAGAGLTGGKSRAQQEEIVQAGKAALAELTAIKKRYDEESNIIIRMQLNSRYKAGIKSLSDFVNDNESDVSYPPLRSQFVKFVKEPSGKLPGDLARKAGQVEEPILSTQDLAKIKKKMEALLQLGDLDGAIRVFREAESDLDKTVNSASSSAAQKQLVRQAKVLNVRAKVGREFATIKLGINGRIIQGSGPSIVIINNKTYTEGDAITDELFIRKIAKDYIEFVFKGVVLKKYQ